MTFLSCRIYSDIHLSNIYGNKYIWIFIHPKKMIFVQHWTGRLSRPETGTAQCLFTMPVHLNADISLPAMQQVVRADTITALTLWKCTGKLCVQEGNKMAVWSNGSKIYALWHYGKSKLLDWIILRADKTDHLFNILSLKALRPKGLTILGMCSIISEINRNLFRK